MNGIGEAAELGDIVSYLTSAVKQSFGTLYPPFHKPSVCRHSNAVVKGLHELKLC